MPRGRRLGHSQAAHQTRRPDGSSAHIWLRAVGARPKQTDIRTNLAKMRLKRGLSQRDMATRTGLSLATYRRLERGLIDNPPIRYLANCAVVLDCSMGEIFEPKYRQWLPLTPAPQTGSGNSKKP